MSGKRSLAQRWLVEGWVAVETIIIIGLSFGLLHELQVNPLMDAWLANRFPSVLYVSNYWTLAGLSAILTVMAGTLIASFKRKQDITGAWKNTHLKTTRRVSARDSVTRMKENQGETQTQTKKDPKISPIRRTLRRTSPKDPYGALGLVLISAGILTLYFSLFVIRTVAMEALGISCIVLGFTASRLPRELTGSRSMGTLLQGAMLDVEALLEPYPVQRAIYLPPENGGPISAFVPLRPSDKPVASEEMRRAPTRILEKDQSGVIVFPVGAELARLPELQDGLSLEEALRYVLVESAEVCSNVHVEEKGNFIVVAMENIKVDTEARKYLSSLGSIPSSLAACVIVTSYKRPMTVVDEREVGHLKIARFSVGS